MGKKDTVTKDYMSEPQYFADAFNYYLFQGKKVIEPEKLSEMDPTEIAIIFDGENKEVVQKIRDVLKECILMEDDKVAYLILGIENHSEIHYAVSVKNMIYDALNYGKQVSEIEKEHRKNKVLKSRKEFLSGLKKTDKLKPVITLTIYFGADEWDAPRCLKEMFDNIEPQILQYVADYKLNLIIPREIKDFSKFTTDFGKVMKFISVSKSKEEYAKLKDDKMFESVNKETVQMINACTGANIKIPEGEEKVNMCEAARLLREEDIASGIQQGINALVETLQELGQTKEFIVETIMKKFSMTKDDAKKYVK